MTKAESDKAAERTSKVIGPLGVAIFLGALWYILFSKKP